MLRSTNNRLILIFEVHMWKKYEIHKNIIIKLSRSKPTKNGIFFNWL